MTILDRYIGKMVAFGTLVALLILLSLIGILELANELNDVGKGQYSITDAFLYVALIMPGYAYELFPVAALLGGLSGLGMLANGSELIAIRAGGISIGRIVLALMKTGALMMSLVFLVGELIAPVSEQRAQNLRAAAISDQITLQTRYGLWTRDGDTFVNIRKVLPDAVLVDLYIYQYDDARRLKKTTHAAYAEYEQDHWRLKDIRETEISPQAVTSRQLEQAVWSSVLDPEMLSVLMVQPAMMPMLQLYKYIEFRQDNSQSAQVYLVAFWGKLATPLVTLVMLYLAVPFVLGSSREVSIGQQVFLGAILGVGFFLVNKAIAHAAVVYAINPVFAAFLPGMLLIGVALVLTRKVY